IPAGTVLLVVCAADAFGPSVSSTPVSTSTAFPSGTPSAGAPSSRIGIAGDLLPDSASTIAININKITTVGGLPAENNEVTYVRLCRWLESNEPTCSNEAPPPLDQFREKGTSYVVSLPAPGRRVTVSTQLCNVRGCADYVFWGTAGMA